MVQGNHHWNRPLSIWTWVVWTKWMSSRLTLTVALEVAGSSKSQSHHLLKIKQNHRLSAVEVTNFKRKKDFQTWNLANRAERHLWTVNKWGWVDLPCLIKSRQTTNRWTQVFTHWHRENKSSSFRLKAKLLETKVWKRLRLEGLQRCTSKGQYWLKNRLNHAWRFWASM